MSHAVILKHPWMEALAVQVKQGSVDPTRDIGEMETLCRELLASGAEESLCE